MDGNQRNRLAVTPLQQSYGQLHQSVRSRAPLVLDVSHSHCIVAHQANHPGPQMRQEVSHSVDDGLLLQSVDVPRSLKCRPLSPWIVECWTASRWTGSLDWDWGLTSSSWWSSRETGAPWWLSGRAVWPVPEYLLWSASRLSRRVASHLAASTALGWASAAWWTLVEKLPTRRGDKWTGTLSCRTRNVDTCGRPGASEHEGRHCVCQSIPSTPDFWWLNGRTLASPSWSVELPCGGWEWRDQSQVTDLLSFWDQEQPAVVP